MFYCPTLYASIPQQSSAMPIYPALASQVASAWEIGVLPLPSGARGDERGMISQDNVWFAYFHTMEVQYGDRRVLTRRAAEVDARKMELAHLKYANEEKRRSLVHRAHTAHVDRVLRELFTYDRQAIVPGAPINNTIPLPSEEDEQRADLNAYALDVNGQINCPPAPRMSTVPLPALDEDEDDDMPMDLLTPPPSPIRVRHRL